MVSKKENGSRVWMRGIKKLWLSWEKRKRLKRTWKSWNKWGLCLRILKQQIAACIHKQSKKKFNLRDNPHHHPLKWVKWVSKEKAQSKEVTVILWVSRWLEPILSETCEYLPTMWTSTRLHAQHLKEAKEHAKIRSVNSLRWLFLPIRFATKRNPPI